LLVGPHRFVAIILVSTNLHPLTETVLRSTFAIMTSHNTVRTCDTTTNNDTWNTCSQDDDDDTGCDAAANPKEANRKSNHNVPLHKKAMLSIPYENNNNDDDNDNDSDEPTHASETTNNPLHDDSTGHLPAVSSTSHFASTSVRAYQEAMVELQQSPQQQHPTPATTEKQPSILRTNSSQSAVASLDDETKNGPSRLPIVKSRGKPTNDIQVDATTTKPNQKGNKVKFHPFTEIKEIANLESYNRKEKKNTWYTLQELDDMRPNQQYVKALFRNCGTHTKLGDCMRGLEFRTKKGAKLRLANHVNAGLAVIDEQEFQLSESLHDPETLAKIYSNRTLKSAQQAHIMALLDELYVRKFVQQISPLPQHVQAQQNAKWQGLRGCTCYINELKKMSTSSGSGTSGGRVTRAGVGVVCQDVNNNQGGGYLNGEMTASARERLMLSLLAMGEEEVVVPPPKKGFLVFFQKCPCPFRVQGNRSGG
jgi:hypothetical protein